MSVQPRADEQDLYLKAYSLLETKISETSIMTSQKSGFVGFSKEQQNHGSEN